MSASVNSGSSAHIHHHTAAVSLRVGKEELLRVAGATGDLCAAGSARELADEGQPSLCAATPRSCRATYIVCCSYMLQMFSYVQAHVEVLSNTCCKWCGCCDVVDVATTKLVMLRDVAMLRMLQQNIFRVAQIIQQYCANVAVVGLMGVWALAGPKIERYSVRKDKSIEKREGQVSRLRGWCRRSVSGHECIDPRGWRAQGRRMCGA